MPITSDQQQLINKYIEQSWEESAIPTLCEFIKIPNKSPDFDPDWEANGYMQQALELLSNWAKQQPIAGMTVSTYQLPNRTPILYIDIPGNNEFTTLLYGHMDKQPEMVGWREDLGPWKPVIEDGKLYGRGSGDDGYSLFCALTAIAALQSQSLPHGRCVVLIEASEESGSSDLDAYLDHLKENIGQPNLVICLDSGCGNYEQMWLTTSLRGLVSGTLTINTLSMGIHSGRGSGICPSVTDILQILLARIQCPKQGQITLPEFQVDVPEYFLQKTKSCAKYMENYLDIYPFVGNTKPITTDLYQALLNISWRSQLAITGIDGIPNLSNAGNVTLPSLTVKLSIRIPPHCDAQAATDALTSVLLSNPPYSSNITFETDGAANGWATDPLPAWLEQACDQASNSYYNRPCAYFGEGGSIPFMETLRIRYPKTQFLITGVLGPGSNPHGPNEFLHLNMTKKLSSCISNVLFAAASTQGVPDN